MNITSENKQTVRTLLEMMVKLNLSEKLMVGIIATLEDETQAMELIRFLEKNPKATESMILHQLTDRKD